MSQLLYKYLILNKKAGLPGVGVFSLDRKPASFDFANKVFVAPAHKIIFSTWAPDSDRQLQAFVAREENITEEQAGVRLKELASKVSEDLFQKRLAVVPGIGVLSRNAEGYVSFQPHGSFNDYFPVVPAERVIRHDAVRKVPAADTDRSTGEAQELIADEQETTGRKNYWWLFAIILALLGIAAVAFYYYRNGAFH